MKSLLAVGSFAALCFSSALLAQEPSPWWNNWRGPLGTGAAPTGNPPTEWSEESNIRWKAAIPGNGCSSPVVWEDRVYVLTAVETDRDGPAAGGDAGGRPRPGRGRRPSRGPSKVHEFLAICYDRGDGSQVWSTTVAECVPHEGTHQTASLASASPIVDGESVYAFFGSRGLHCLDLDGDVKWSLDFGQMRILNSFGEGASPALYGDRLIVNWDHEGDSFLAAFDKRTGKELWRTPRDEITSWPTPLVVEVAGRPQIVLPATRASRGYDLATGKELWSLRGMTRFCVPTPVHHEGLVYLMSGYSGNVLQAVRLRGAKGELDGTDQVVWTHDERTSYTPSALLHDGLLYFLRTNSAELSCLDARTGEVKYSGQRLSGLRDVYSSPVAANGRIYITSREGVTKVLKAGPEYEEIATNELDDVIDGTAAIVGDEILLRGRRSLYCIAHQD